MDGLEDFVSFLDRLYSKWSVQVDFEKLREEPPVEYMAQVLWLIFGIYTAKYRELTSSVIQATNDKTFLVFALCGRAIIETTATLRYYNNKFLGQIRTAKDPDAFDADEIKSIIELLDTHSRGGRFNWAMFLTSPRSDMVKHLVDAGKNKIKGSQTNPEQINVKTTISKWAKDQPEVLLAYDFFCELVHPNLGSNFMMMGYKDTSVEVCGTTEKALARSIAIEGIQFLAPVIKEAQLCQVNLLGWAASIKQEPKF